MQNSVLAAIVAIAAVGAAQFLGSYFRSDVHPDIWNWYQRLDKPKFIESGATLAFAWVILDALLAYSGYRLMTAEHGRFSWLALVFWALIVISIPARLITLYGRRRLDEATIVAGGMLLSSIALLVVATTVDQRAAWAALPLAAWLVIAMYLQEEMWRRNR
jgi:translocator protein